MTEQELREMALMNKIRIDVARGVLEKVETNPTRFTGPAFVEVRKVLDILERWSATLEYQLREVI